MLRIAIKARLAVQVGHLYQRCNAERSSEHLTRRACQRIVLALLPALRRCPTCAAASAAPKRFSGTLSPQILLQQAASIPHE